MTLNRAYSLLDIKAVQDEQRIIVGTATTPTPDRVGDVVEPKGAEFTLPIPFLWQHDSRRPVGNVTKARVTGKGIEVEVQIEKTDEPGEVKDRLDAAWQEIKLGLVRGLSIGFKPLQSEPIKGTFGERFIRWLWLELSGVTIAMNGECTIDLIKSIDAAALAASGQERNGSEQNPAGVTARKATPVVKATTMTKKTIAEQISAFENTRAAKSARMTELMDAAAEKGETLDEAGTQEYDGLAAEVKSVDAHLVRLRELEAANKAAAVEVKGASQDDAGKSRAGVRVEVLKTKLLPGIGFTRFVKACAAAPGNLMQALEMAKSNEQWRAETPEVEICLKAAVAAGTTTGTTWAAPLVEYQVLTSEFAEYLRPLTIIGRIPNLRQVPFKIKVPRQTAAASVNWVGEGKPKPVSALAFDSITMDHYKIAGIVALTEELVRLSNPSAERLVRDDLAKGIVQFMDTEFTDPDKSESAGVSPASVTNGVTPRTASGTDYAALVADVKFIMANFFVANLTPTAVIMSQAQALSFSLMENSLGQKRFPDLNQSGGTFMGLPAITSENIQYTEDSPQEGSPIIFLVAPEIMLADDGQVNIDASREASLQMDSAPTDPVSASTVLVSLWQHNMVGIRAERMVNWKKRRSAAVQFISAGKYA